MGELKTTTYTDQDGTRQEAVYYTGQPLTKKRETYCQQRAFGADRLTAYRTAYYCDGGAPTDNAVSKMAYELEQDTDVILRIQELKRPVLKKFRRKFEYTLQKALEQCQTAWDVAFAQGNVNGLLKAIELQGKFMKLLTEQVNVTHKHGLLDDADTETLLEMRKIAEARRGSVKVIGIETVEKNGNGSGRGV